MNQHFNSAHNDHFDADPDEFIEGRNPVLEALKAGHPIGKLYLLRTREEDGRLLQIEALARQAGAVIMECDRERLDSMTRTGVHQGVIAVAAAVAFSSIPDILQNAAASGRRPLVVVCDGITDPHNLGAVIRNAETAGAHGVIIPKRRSAGLTSVTDKASAGALEHIPVARVSNIASALAELKNNGLWIYGSSGSGDLLYYNADLTLPCAIVIGSEGSGLSHLVGESCDMMLKIPVMGHISSLNASAAAAVLLFESVRQRLPLSN